MTAMDRIAGAALCAEDLARYRRQLILDEVGIDGQAALKAARIAVVGSGGLGAPALLYLVAAGVGQITLIDFDTIDLSNLHRQVLFGEADIGRRKTESATDRLMALNPTVALTVVEARLDDVNARDILHGHDLVLDATDNFRARYAINDAAVAEGIPNVSASILRFEAQLTVYDPAGGGPCYRCLYASPPPSDLAPSCAEAGVIGVLPGIVGCLQANEAIKLICGYGTPLAGRLVTFDAIDTRFREFSIARRPDCSCCADAGRRVVSAMRSGPAEISVTDLRAALDTARPPLVLDVRGPDERAQGMIPDAIGIALDDLPARLGEVPRDRRIACICKSGKRSLLAASLLMHEGFADVINIAGGMDAWGDHDA